MKKTQAIYEHEFDARLRSSPPVKINSGDDAFACKEYCNPEREKRHTLLPIAKGPFRLIFVTPDTVCLICKTNTSSCPATVSSLSHPQHNRHRQAPLLASSVPNHRCHLGPCPFCTCTAASPTYQTSLLTPPRAIIACTGISYPQHSIAPSKEGARAHMKSNLRQKHELFCHSRNLQ